MTCFSREVYVSLPDLALLLLLPLDEDEATSGATSLNASETTAVNCLLGANGSVLLPAVKRF
jgi:hypothetical protein